MRLTQKQDGRAKKAMRFTHQEESATEAAPFDDHEEERATQATPFDSGCGKTAWPLGPGTTHDDYEHEAEAQEESEAEAQDNMEHDTYAAWLPSGSELLMQAARQTVPDDWPVPSEDAPMHVGFEYSAIAADDDDDEHIVPDLHDPQEDDYFFDCEEMAHYDGPADYCMTVLGPQRLATACTTA